MPRIACFGAEWALLPATPRMPAPDEVLTTTPPPCFSICAICTGSKDGSSRPVHVLPQLGFPYPTRVRLPAPTDDARHPARTRLENDHLVIRGHKVAVEAAGHEPTDRDVPHRVCGKPLRDHAPPANAHAAALRIARSRDEQ